MCICTCKPWHLPSLAALAWAYQQAGQPAVQRQVCRQLVRRADEVQAAPDLPALHAARHVLQADA